jgi:hypothetical protein
LVETISFLETHNALPQSHNGVMKRQDLDSVARFLARHPRWMVAGAIVYFLSPVDLVPEALVGPVGYLDDLIVMVLPMVIMEYVRRRRPRPGGEVIDTTAEEDPRASR